MGIFGGTPAQTTVTQRPDAQSQGYIDRMRQAAQGAAGMATGMPGNFFSGPLQFGQIQAAMNPYIQGVVDPTRAEFDYMRGQAAGGANADATQAGAYGGDRAALMASNRMGNLDRAQASQMAGLYSGGYNAAVQLAEHNRQLAQQQAMEPLWRQQQGLNFMNQGIGPVGTTSTQSQTPGQDPFGSAFGGALAGFGAGGPWGALAGGGLGLLGGLFG